MFRFSFPIASPHLEQAVFVTSLTFENSYSARITTKLRYPPYPLTLVYNT